MRVALENSLEQPVTWSPFLRSIHLVRVAVEPYDPRASYRPSKPRDPSPPDDRRTHQGPSVYTSAPHEPSPGAQGVPYLVFSHAIAEMRDPIPRRQIGPRTPRRCVTGWPRRAHEHAARGGSEAVVPSAMSGSRPRRTSPAGLRSRSIPASRRRVGMIVSGQRSRLVDRLHEKWNVSLRAMFHRKRPSRARSTARPCRARRSCDRREVRPALLVSRRNVAPGPRHDRLRYGGGLADPIVIRRVRRSPFQQPGHEPKT